MKLSEINAVYRRVDDGIDRRLGDKRRFQTCRGVSAILAEDDMKPVSVVEGRVRAIFVAWAIDAGVFGGQPLDQVLELVK